MAELLQKIYSFVHRFGNLPDSYFRIDYVLETCACKETIRKFSFEVHEGENVTKAIDKLHTKEKL